MKNQAWKLLYYAASGFEMLMAQLKRLPEWLNFLPPPQ
jgi:hypothetical protein